jgi:DNA-binding MarR family transcriptional regulator
MNHIQETSRQAYEAIQPTLTERQRPVLKFIEQFGPVTNREIAAGLHLDINQVTPRTNELVKLNLVEAAGRKKDPVTNKSGITWSAIRTMF